jgi:hypothetical protein
MAEHVGAAHTVPLGLIGAEDRSEITEAGRAQQRVAQRMSGDITVGMTGAAVGLVEQQAEQPTGPPGLDGMNVGPETDAQIRHIAFRDG